jgi:hypothetical protein
MQYKQYYCQLSKYAHLQYKNTSLYVALNRKNVIITRIEYSKLRFMHEGIKIISVFLLQGSVVCNMCLPLRDAVTDSELCILFLLLG